MKIIELPIQQLNEAPWNSNQMDLRMFLRLKESLGRYGLVEPLVVRPIADGLHEVLSGNHRLRAIHEMGFQKVSCVVVKLADTEAMLLAQVLNNLHGDDDLGRKGVIFQKILEAIPEGEVLSLLPETAESLQALSSINQHDLAQHLQAWELAQAARLNHMTLQFTAKQLDIVNEAIDLVIHEIGELKEVNPSNRSISIFLICKYYLERRKES